MNPKHFPCKAEYGEDPAITMYQESEYARDGARYHIESGPVRFGVPIVALTLIASFFLASGSPEWMAGMASAGGIFLAFRWRTIIQVAKRQERKHLGILTKLEEEMPLKRFTEKKINPIKEIFEPEMPWRLVTGIHAVASLAVAGTIMW